MTENISLTGNLSHFYLSNILQLISSNHKTGTLKINQDKKNVSIIFKEGTIIFASTNKAELRLGVLLERKGIITETQLKHFLHLSKKKNIALGKLLVEENVITFDILKSFVKKQIEEILYELFFWKGGNFIYDDTLPDFSKVIVIPLDIVFLILEASRRLDEMTVLQKHIPNNNIVFELTEKSKEKNIAFVSNEWSILNMIDGKRNIQKIIKKSNLDKFSIYKMLFSLISSGFIKKT